MNTIIIKKLARNSYVSVLAGNELVLTENEKRITLARGVEDDFDVCLGEDGSIDVFAVAKTGNLMHIRYHKDTITTYSVMEKRSEEKHIRAVRAVALRGRFHLFYCLEGSERLLVHHIAQFGDYGTKPVVVDRIGSKCIYDVTVDENYNFHIIYVSADYRLLYRRFDYSQKAYTVSREVLQCDIRSLASVWHNDKLYCAFCGTEKGRFSVYVCDVFSSNAVAVGIRVHMLSKVALLSADENLLVEWTENSMCFGVECSEELSPSKVITFGKSGGLFGIKAAGGKTAGDRAVCSPSARPFNEEKLVKWSKSEPNPRPKGYVIDQLSKKYLEVLSAKNEFVDFGAEFARIEASLEKLVILVQKALEIHTADSNEEYNGDEINKEE